MGKSKHRQICVFSSELRRINQTLKKSRAYVPELEANGAVFEVHRLGQEVDPDRRLHHGGGSR